MRRIVSIICLSLITLLSSISLVAMATAVPKHQPAKQASVALYASPKNTAKVIKHLSPRQRLVTIYIHGKWIKVGDPQDGSVGWINRDQYNAAVKAYFTPTIQTVFLHSETSKDGKPKLNIVAYSNGKKLSDKQARAFYQRLKRQQQKQWQSMRAMNLHVRHMFDREVDEMNRLFSNLPSLGFAPAVIQPIIVINQPGAPAKKPAHAPPAPTAKTAGHKHPS